MIERAEAPYLVKPCGCQLYANSPHLSCSQHTYIPPNVRAILDNAALSTLNSDEIAWLREHLERAS